MSEMDLNETINKLVRHKINPVRQKKRMSLGDAEQCRLIFESAFLACDKTVKKFEMLPEYLEIVEWMANFDKGLLLTGSCGRGKTTILTGVIPIVFMHLSNKVVRPFIAVEMGKKMDEILRSVIICLDDVGTEQVVNDYGVKFEGFNRIVDNAETHQKLLFVSTNLTVEQIVSRYGERTLDRLTRLCKVVQFSGDSLR